MAKEKILVTGATGTTGRRTVEILRDHGREVRAIVHKESPASERLQSLGGDLLDFIRFDPPSTISARPTSAIRCGRAP
jgi:NAD(P)H dehydrogenase (quinone)